MIYDCSESFLLAYTWDMTWISKTKMFVRSISTSYLFKLSDKYFEMSYPMDITNINKMFVKMVYPCPIFLNFRTNIYPIDISITNISLVYLHFIPPRASSALGALRLLRMTLAAPSSESSRPSLRTLHHCYVQLLICSHRQAPQTTSAPPKLPQPMVHVASLLDARI